MDAKMLDRCREVEYTKGPAGRKGSRKCAECGFYFAPSEKKYPFYDVDGPPPDGTVYRSGIDWYEETGCCPNCDLPYLRRCIGKRNHGGSWTRGCGQWLQFANEYERDNEKKKVHRRQMCADCSLNSGSQMKQRLLAQGYMLIEELGRIPTAQEWEERGGSHWNISKVFGSWNVYVSTLGGQPRQRGSQNGSPPTPGSFKRVYTSNEILRRMGTEAEKMGRALTMKEWDAAGMRPSSSLIKRRFGWRLAWEKVGYKTAPRIGDGTPAAVALGKKGNETRFGPTAGRPAYEILNDPDSEYNRMRREIAAKQGRYEREMAVAAERFEQAKFRPKDAEDGDT